MTAYLDGTTLVVTCADMAEVDALKAWWAGLEFREVGYDFVLRCPPEEEVDYNAS